MKKILVIISFFIVNHSFSQSYTISSPDKRIRLEFVQTPGGQPTYNLHYQQQAVVSMGTLGFLINEDKGFVRNLTLVSVDSSYVDNNWEPVWGEERSIRNNYRQLAVTLQQKDDKQLLLRIVFRLFDKGLGFRYEFPQQPNLQYFVVKDELTSFVLGGDHKAWWIPGDYDTNEYPYSVSKLSEVDAFAAGNATEISTRKVFAAKGVQTPLMLKTDEGLYINIHEAALVNYPAMQLQVETGINVGTVFIIGIVPDAVGNKAYFKAPSNTPWRVINVSDKATDILACASFLI